MVCMIFPNKPWTISKPEVLPTYKAAQLRWLKAPLSNSGFFKTISPHSNTLIGNECFLFSLTVFKIPGNKVVLTTWYSIVFGFSNLTALVPSSFCFNQAKFSS